MLLKVLPNWRLLQVGNGEEHPDEGIFGYMTCPCCSSHLHGHGWRKRHLEKEPGRFIQVWIHRKRCPHCRRTYTLIPEGMAAIAQYPLERIREALCYRAVHGNCTVRLHIPTRTQKRWWRNFMLRTKASSGMFPSDAAIADAARDPTPLSTLPLGWIAVNDPAELRSLAACSGPSHHIMLLPRHQTPW